VKRAGLIPWARGPRVLFGFIKEKYSKARSIWKRYYTTRVVRHWYVIL